MKNIFYRFSAEDIKGCIRIKPKIKYETLELLGKESPLVYYNEFIIANGKKKFSIIQFDDSMNFAISKQVKSLLEVNGITGWSCFPILIEGINDEYFAFQNLSKAGPILNLEALNNYETENTEFDINTWDGSDIFNLKDTLLNACTPRVKELFEKERITNLQMLPL